MPRQESSPEPANVRVRMYRQGLGDCFLLTFPDRQGSPFHILIDSGVLLGTDGAPKTMTDVACDIAETTKNHLNVLVVTHEHWDHISGFIQAKDIFQKITIDNLWLAWTEDPSNRLAQQLRRQRKQTERALRVAVRRMREHGMSSAARFEEVLRFFGDGLGAAGSSTASALQAVQDFAKNAPTYCRPRNDPITLERLPNVRFYVLGPPEDEKKIKKSDPTKRGKEVYEFGSLALTSETAFLIAAMGGNGLLGDSPEQDQDLAQAARPFDGRSERNVDQARKDRFFQNLYFDERNSWRQIDNDWLEITGSLALQLDSDTNNTSLVLAIELIDSGKVLLFPGDAQVGNWLSWADYAWTVADARGDKQEVTAAELLKRTVLYKVGHHGSHNATLREAGLEQMVSPDLIAMIPVTRDMARRKRWAMPFRPLLNRLMEKTSGRILQVDDPPICTRPAPEGTSRVAWEAFKKRVHEEKLYFEVAVPFLGNR